MGNNAKKEFLNNIIIQMSDCVDRDILQILEQSITAELVKVNMDSIPTLPALIDDTDDKNQDIIKLYIYKKRIKDSTKKAYLFTVKSLLTLIHKPLTKMDEADISYYLHWYEKRPGVQASTYNNARRNLSAFFTWMRKEKMISDNPVDAIEPKRVVQKPIDYFSGQEIIRLREACKNRKERALLEVLRSTGARAGELVHITTDQIDWETGDALILGEKNDKYRTIYLDEDARYYLYEYIKNRGFDSPYLFPRSQSPHSVMTINGIYGVFHGIGKRAKMEVRVYPHKMRKTLGMSLKNKGVDLGIIQEIMGHSNPAVTAQYYAQSTPATLRYVRERLA
jgi:site-specific recombinase XerD